MTEETEVLDPLTTKDIATLAEYFKSWNGTQAWMSTHPKSGYNAARSSASEWLTKPNVIAAIKDRLETMHMSADEALKLQADIARADVGAIMETTTFGYNFDMKKAKETGFTKLIKKVKQKTVTIMGKGADADDTEIHTLEIELYDSQAAIRDVLKVHGKFTEKVDVTSGGEKLKPEDMKPSEIAERVAALLKGKDANSG